MEKKDLDFRMEAIDEALGVFKGHASLYDTVDSYNEVVTRGAFTKSLEESKGIYPLCWFHNVIEPLGIAIAQDGMQGLQIEGHLNLDVKSAREKYSLMKQGVIKGLSIGFKTVRDEWRDDIRRLKEIRLFEISPITLNFQACPGAEISDVKGKSLDELLDLYEASLVEFAKSAGAVMRERAEAAIKAQESYFESIRDLYSELYGGRR